MGRRMRSADDASAIGPIQECMVFFNKSQASASACSCAADRLSICVDACNQHKGNTSRFTGAVGPGMVGSTLNQNIARSQHGLFFIHDGSQLSFQHERVVHGVRAMHARMFAGLNISMGIAIHA